MNSAKLNDWIQVIGIIAIVVSLIFVGYEIRQSHDIAVAAAYQERAMNAIDVISARAQVDFIVERQGQSLAANSIPNIPTELSPKELGDWYFGERLTFVSYENNHYQWQAGYLSDEDWEPYRVSLRSLLSGNPMARYMAEARGYLYRKSFQDYCRILISEIDSEVSVSE